MTVEASSGSAIRRISVCQDGAVVGKSADSDRLAFVYENRLASHPFDVLVETQDMDAWIDDPPGARLTARYLGP